MLDFYRYISVSVSQHTSKVCNCKIEFAWNWKILKLLLLLLLDWIQSIPRKKIEHKIHQVRWNSVEIITSFEKIHKQFCHFPLAFFLALFHNKKFAHWFWQFHNLNDQFIFSTLHFTFYSEKKEKKVAMMEVIKHPKTAKRIKRRRRRNKWVNLHLII